MTLEQKVDKILQLLEGDGDDMPGLKAQIAEMRRDVYGYKNHWGMKPKLEMMWKSWIWLLCTASGAAGAGLLAIGKMISKIIQ